MTFTVIYGGEDYSISYKQKSCLEEFANYINQNDRSTAIGLSYKVHDSIQSDDDSEEYIESLIQQFSIYYVGGNHDSARIVAAIAESITNLDINISYNLKSKVYYNQGLIFYHLRQWDSSKTYFIKSNEFAVKAKLDSIVSLSLKSLGNIYFSNRDYGKALDFYIMSLQKVYSSNHPSNIIISSLFQNIGISYSMLNINDSALKYLKRSIEMKEIYLKPDDPMLGSGYLNLSRLVQLNGELDEALDYIDKAEQIYLSNPGESTYILAPLYLNKGSILLTLNDYDEALHYHELAFEQYKTGTGFDSEIIAGLFLNFGLLYNNLDRLSESIKYLELSLLEDLSDEQRVKAYYLLGLSNLKQKSYIKANENFLKAIEISEKKLGNANIQTANTFFNFAVFCEQSENNTDPLPYYLKAAAIYEKIFGEKNRDLSYTYTLIGDYYLKRNKYEIANEYFQKALITFVDDFDLTNSNDNPSFDQLEADLYLFYTLSGKSTSKYLKYLNESEDKSDLIVSLETGILAIDLFEKIKSTLYGENTKLIVIKRVNEIYNLVTTLAAELCLEFGDYNYLETCFQYSEKGKAAVLLSSLKEHEAIEIGNIPNEIKEKEKKLKRSILQYQNVIYEENIKYEIDSIKISDFRNKLFESKIKYDSLIKALESNYPEYYNLKYNFDVITISQIQDKLKNNQVFVEYKLTDSTLFTFIIRKDTAILKKTHVGNSFSLKVNEYLKLINQVPKTDSVSARAMSFALLGVELTNLLELNNPLVSSCEKMIIIPDDILGYLSFDALITELPDDKKAISYNQLKYLIFRHSISFGYSGTLLFNREERPTGNSKVLAIAPSYDNIRNGQYAKTNNTIRDIEKYLIPLPNTITEVNSIAEIYDGNQFVGTDATETKFKSMASEYSILHFAMHTLINDDEPLASKLVFALNNDTVNDGFLNTYEIYNLDLKADLAVLSACRTGTGKISKGEGIMSLARGFLYAGVPGIVMTLWAIEDISGAEIITAFYTFLQLGQDKDVALRNAKLSYLDNADPLHSHPYFWAAYVQIGNNSPILSSKTHLVYYFAIPGGLMTVIAIFFLLRRRGVKIGRK